MLRVPTVSTPVDAHITVPGSKSIANRALICAALADGTTELANVPDGDDTDAMIGCVRALGLDAELVDGRVSITGADGQWPATPEVLHTALAGTTSRFVTALAALGSTPLTIDGEPPLRRRPFAPLHEALLQLGVEVHPGETFGHLPATIKGPPTTGSIEMRGDVSSQYVSALMLIGPYLPDGLRLRLTSELVSKPYVHLTAAVMAEFGVDDVEVGEQLIRVAPAAYRPTRLTIEPDASSASYPLAVAAIAGGSVTIPGLGRRSDQGDARFADLLATMGCRVDWGTDEVTVRGDGRLSGIDVDMADISDLVPSLAAVAAFADTPTRIRNVGFIRRKESDRIGDLAGELRRAGVDISEEPDGLEIRPSRATLGAARLATHHDHRLAMAFGVLGTCVPGIDVEEPAVVSKSWPGFWTMLDDSFA